MIELQPDGGLSVRPFLSVTLGILALFLGKAVNRVSAFFANTTSQKRFRAVCCFPLHFG